MSRCKCGSYAINIHHHGRDGVSDLDLCDVCYWRKRAGGMIGQGSPSGVVEAQITFVIERLDRGEDINGDAAKYLAGWLKLALASLPQAPATPAAAPVEEESRWCKSCGLAREWHRPEVAMIGSDGKPCKDFVPQPKTRAPGSQGAAPGPGVVEALRFYADEDNYYGKYNGEKQRLPAIAEDMGDLARQAIAALKNQQEKK